MSGSILCRCGHEHVDPLELGAASMACGTCNCRSFREKPAPKRVAPSAETRVSDERLEELIQFHTGMGTTFYKDASCEDAEVSEALRELLSIRRSAAPPAATNCCTATEVEAARNPEKSLEERAQEAAEEIESAYRKNQMILPGEPEIKAIILSRIGGAE